MAVTVYPYKPGSITPRQAVKLIADVVYPGQDETLARKRVRERIRYGCKKGKLPATISFGDAAFFDWACTQPKWAALTKVEGLPRSATRVKASLTALWDLMDDDVEAPDDPVELREQFLQRVVELRQCTKANEGLKREVEELRAELLGWLEKDRAMREMRSKNGKKGGRGKER